MCKKTLNGLVLFFALFFVLVISGNAAGMSVWSEAEVVKDKIVVNTSLSQPIKDECIIAVLYDESGRVSDCVFLSGLNGKNQAEIEFDYNDAADMVKVFVVENMASIKPLSECEEVSVPKSGAAGLDYNIMIITEDSDGLWYDLRYNEQLGREIPYVYALIDGSFDFVPIETEADIWPKLTKENADYYINKISSYTVDGNGLYTVMPIACAYNSPDMSLENYIGFNKDKNVLSDKSDDTLLFTESIAGIASLERDTGDIYSLTDAATDLILTEYSKIIIKDFGNSQMPEFIVYDKGSLENIGKLSSLVNVQYIVKNNTNYDGKEYLCYLFAEVVNSNCFDEAIIKNSYPAIDENGKYRRYYEIYDLMLGSINEIPGSFSYDNAVQVAEIFAPGDVVSVYKNAAVDESKSPVSKLTSNENLYWIVDFDEYVDIIEVIKIGDVNADGSFSYEDVRALSIGDTFITKIGNDAESLGERFFKFGTITKIAHDDFSLTDVNLKAVNKTYVGQDGRIQTIYGNYVKAYISMSGSLDYAGRADYISVIVNGNEPIEHCDID